jgi:two-component system sensor histidine kinase HydH
MPKTPPPAGFEEIHREELSRLFGRVMLVRFALVPVVVVLVALLLAYPVTPWRRAVLVTLGLGAAALFAHEVLPYRRRGPGGRGFAINLAFASVGQAVAALATGGLESPFFFVMFPIAFAVAAVAESGLAFSLVAVQMVEVWLMAWVQIDSLLPHMNPSWFGGDAVPGWNHAHVLWSAGFASAGLCVVTFLGRGIRASFERMVRRGLAAREEALRAHQDRARELAALSGEIAHELKNPLASIKGLSALLAQDTAAGKPAERLRVLRREVDRMQVILDEFLNFSRPLAPLTIEQVDPGALLDEVAQMHEGMAHERGVRLLVRSEAGPLRCDPRKLKQAIINLVQNAIEASPPGGVVEIAAEAGAEARIRVIDRGSGVDPALADKVFEAGVTSKPRGFGLGLTIARALARQHGGDLALSSREGGGSIAEIRLPKDLP